MHFYSTDVIIVRLLRCYVLRPPHLSEGRLTSHSLVDFTAADQDRQETSLVSCPTVRLLWVLRVQAERQFLTLFEPFNKCRRMLLHRLPMMHTDFKFWAAARTFGSNCVLFRATLVPLPKDTESLTQPWTLITTLCTASRSHGRFVRYSP